MAGSAADAVGFLYFSCGPSWRRFGCGREDLTGGTFLFPEGLAHCLRGHSVPPDQRSLEQMRSLEFRVPRLAGQRALPMIISETRIQRFIASAGYERVISEGQWREICQLLLESVGSGLCYSFCLVTQQEPPGKFLRADFPDELLKNIRYLHKVHLYVLDEDARSRLERLLDGWGVDYSYLHQLEPDTGRQEVVAVRLVGYRKAGSQERDGAPRQSKSDRPRR